MIRSDAGTHAETASGANSSDGELCRRVLEYRDIMTRLVDEAKRPGFNVTGWAPLAELVAVDEFKRVGAFREIMNWCEYTEFLTRWARSCEWESSFRRIHEWAGVVFLELEERSVVGGRRDVVNSILRVQRCRQAPASRHLLAAGALICGLRRLLWDRFRRAGRSPRAVASRG